MVVTQSSRLALSMLAAPVYEERLNLNSPIIASSTFP